MNGSFHDEQDRLLREAGRDHLAGADLPAEAADSLRVELGHGFARRRARRRRWTAGVAAGFILGVTLVGFQTDVIVRSGGGHAVVSSFTDAGLTILQLPDDMATGDVLLNPGVFASATMSSTAAFGLGKVVNATAAEFPIHFQGRSQEMLGFPHHHIAGRVDGGQRPYGRAIAAP